MSNAGGWFVKIMVLSHALIISSVLLLSGCDDKDSGVKVKEELQRKEQVRVIEGDKQKVPVKLDLSLNFDELEFKKSANAQGSNTQQQVQGVFEIEKKASNIKIDAGFEESYNENKELETASDGVGVEFNLGF